MKPRTILVVEDGTEYVDAFRGLASTGDPSVVWLHASDAAAARRILAEREVDAVFLDVVFDRTPPEALAGDLEGLVRRFGGDRKRALEHLAANQGFYVAAELAGAIPRDARILIAFDFTSDPERLSVLRESLPGLDGVEEGAPATKLLRRLLE